MFVVRLIGASLILATAPRTAQPIADGPERPLRIAWIKLGGKVTGIPNPSRPMPLFQSTVY
jgi:hypothetical protein